MKIKVILFIMLSVLCVNSLNAQKSNKRITISGTVLNAAKEPIANAIVMIDDKNTSTTTDAKGNYRIKVKSTASRIGIFTFGNGTIEEPINGREQIDFNFATKAPQQAAEQTIAPGDQGINTGYGSIKKKNLTTDVNKIDGTNKKYANYSTIGEMIQREVSGVKVSGNVVVIQGSKDLFGAVTALIVVDGVAMDVIPNIPPASVKSIEVLKGTAAAIYGSRGYGGAIIIKTKVGNE